MTICAEQAPVAGGTARLLSLAAAPIFAGMAVLTGWQEAAPPDSFCAAMTHDAAPFGVPLGGIPLGSMTVMYLLMSAVHAAPWLRLIGRRRC